MISAIVAAIPLILKILELLFTTKPESREQVVASVLERVSAIKAAVKKAQDTGGDTSDLEAIIGKRPG